MAQGEYNLNFKSLSQKKKRLGIKRTAIGQNWKCIFWDWTVNFLGRFIFWSNLFFSNKENVKSAKAKTQIDIEEKTILKTTLILMKTMI